MNVLRHPLWQSLTSVCRHPSFPSDRLQINQRAIHSNKTQISKHLRLREVPNSSKADRPLVILFDWLYAKPSAVDKYCDLYHENGLDVLTVQGGVAQFLWPPNSYKLSEELMSYLLSARKPEKYIIHAFSIGAYNYDVAMMNSFQNPKLYGEFRTRVAGQIFDSVTIGGYDQMSRGLATILPPVKIIQKSALGILDAFYHLTRKQTKLEYDRLVRFFKEQPIKVPTLLFYCKNDPMCDVDSIEEMIEQWKGMDGFDVTSKCWDKSIHCAHLRCHPDDYKKCWNDFMQKILK